MPTLLITGGSGYLGGELARQARDTGAWDVVATYTSNLIQVDGVHAISLDLREQHASAALRQLRPDAIMHTAYVQRGPDLWRISAEGARQIALYAQEVGARLIHMSSDALFDGERETAYTEADMPSPITPYGEAKAAAERFVREASPNALIVRTSLIYGGETPSPHEQFVFDALDGTNDAVFFTDEIRNPIQVGDLASALLELLPNDTQGILHVAGADAISRFEFAQLIARAAGRSPDPLRSGLSAASGVRRPRHVMLDSTQARAMLRTRLRGARAVLGRR